MVPNRDASIPIVSVSSESKIELPVSSFRVSIIFSSLRSNRYIPVGLNALLKSHHFFVDGRIFSWGSNQFGQCGIGDRASRVSTPQQVTSLQGLPVSQIAAGGNHSFILSISGALFGWGKNE